jgi:hypothetical protein
VGRGVSVGIGLGVLAEVGGGEGGVAGSSGLSALADVTAPSCLPRLNGSANASRLPTVIAQANAYPADRTVRRRREEILPDMSASHA